jgi:hypothetical protein
VLAGGVIGAILGPEYAKHAREAMAIPYSAVFLVSACVFALLFVLLLAGRRVLSGLALPPRGPPSDDAAAAPPRRSLRNVFSQPRCLASTLVATLAMASMVFLMSALPLEMVGGVGGHSFAQSSLTIQIHMVCMFAPSFVTGHVVKRYGVQLVQVAGALLIISGGLIGMISSAGSFPAFIANQACMGLGWNLCFTASTAGFSRQLRKSEMVRAQALNDVTIFLISGLASAVAAPALAAMGWPKIQGAAIGSGAAIILVILATEVAARYRPIKEQEGVEARRHVSGISAVALSSSSSSRAANTAAVRAVEVDMVDGVDT